MILLDIAIRGNTQDPQLLGGDAKQIQESHTCQSIFVCHIKGFFTHLFIICGSGLSEL